MRQKPLLIRAMTVDLDGSSRMLTHNLDDIEYKPTGTTPLTDEQREHAADLYRRAPSYIRRQHTLASWTEGFSAERNPARELAVWDAILDTVRELRTYYTNLASRYSDDTLGHVVTLLSIGTVDVSGVAGVNEKLVTRAAMLLARRLNRIDRGA